MRKRPNIPWATEVQVRPSTPLRTAPATDVSEDPVPELRLELPPFPIELLAVRPGPPRPRVSAPLAANGGKDAEKLEAPAISLQLTPQETKVAQQETNQSLSIAEKNLAAVQRLKLNAAQSDMASKIRSFIKDAREAIRMDDWSRAHNMAKKAQVLSEELSGSF